MAQNIGSAAYDLSLFETKKAPVVALKPNKKVKRQEKRRSRIQTILNVCAIGLAVGVVLVVFSMMIVSRVRLTEMNETLSELQENLGVLQSENIRLNTELCGIASAEKVEAYAEEHGLQKTEFHQIEYFTVDGGDRIEAPGASSGGFLTSIWNAITGIF
ncbi:MAG: hypothetical protein IKI63_06505 [Clostridia bacterium]|nr:hypothetical protein [Clostridia bacterium]